MRLPGYLSRHTEFIGHVATLISGKSVAVVIGLITMPIVARLFEPSDFGVAAVYMSIVGILASIATLRYHLAIILPESDDRALDLITLSYQLIIVVSILTTIVLVLIEISDFNIPGLDILGNWQWLLPLGVLLMASIQTREIWLTRKKAFKRSSVSMIASNLSSGVSRIGFGLVGGTSVYGLIIGNLCGMVARLAAQQPECRGTTANVVRHVDWQKSRRIAREYADFPKLDGPAELIAALGESLPVLLFGVLFSPAVAGFYAMANRLARIPIAAVFKAMFRVFFQKATEIHNRGASLYRALSKATVGLAVVGVVPALLLWLFGQEVLEWVLGTRWSEAGIYLEIMAPWIFIAWVMSPSNAVFKVLRRQELLLVTHILLTAFRIGAFGIAFLLGVGAETTLEYFVLATVLANVIRIVLAFYAIRRHPVAEALATGDK